MKFIGFLLASFFFFNAESTEKQKLATIGPRTLVCEHHNGNINCHYFADGGNCFIGIDGDNISVSGPDC